MRVLILNFRNDGDTNNLILKQNESSGNLVNLLGQTAIQISQVI